MKNSDIEKLIALIKTFPECNSENLDHDLNNEQTPYMKLKVLMLYAYQLGYANGIQYAVNMESYRNF